MSAVEQEYESESGGIGEGLRVGGVVAAVGLMIMGTLAWAAWWERDDSLDRVRGQGVLRIGYAVAAPYAFVTEEGEVTGEAPAIAREMARAIGAGGIRWRQYSFGELIDRLRAGEVDVVAAGMFITPEREKVVAFSRPTCRVEMGLLVARGNPAGLRAYADITGNPAARVAVLPGSVELEMLQAKGVDVEQLFEVPDATTGLAAIRTGLVDGLALSIPTVRWMAETSAGSFESAEMVSLPQDEQQAGYPAFVFRKEDRRLREAWDAQLERWLGGRTHREIARRFGFSESEWQVVVRPEEGDQP